MQATKVVVEKVKTVIEKVQSIKVKKATTLQINAKKTLTKTMRKKGELNKIPDICITIQGNENCIQLE